jgi:hypothetical protein
VKQKRIQADIPMKINRIEAVAVSGRGRGGGKIAKSKAE